MFEFTEKEAVTQFLSYSHTSIDDAVSYIKKKVEAYENENCLMWGIECKNTGKYIGNYRIEGRCFVENRASARGMEKSNMSFEGILRQQVFIKGKFRDLKMYSILAEEYDGKNR